MISREAIDGWAVGDEIKISHKGSNIVLHYGKVMGIVEDDQQQSIILLLNDGSKFGFVVRRRKNKDDPWRSVDAGSEV